MFSMWLVTRKNKNIFKNKEFILSLRVVYNNKACVLITYMFSTLIIKTLLRRFKLLRSWLFECSTTVHKIWCFACYRLVTIFITAN